MAEVPHNVLYATEAEGAEDSRELETTSEAEQQTELDRTTQVSKNIDVQAQLKVGSRCIHHFSCLSFQIYW